jgi:hypothetical protein
MVMLLDDDVEIEGAINQEHLLPWFGSPPNQGKAKTYDFMEAWFSTGWSFPHNLYSTLMS